ncbi:bromodomain-containing protein 8 [Caerostris darwini]|uniref:Bromodomain-containing protein 8 n=1 Tax=Caerostris darwini TaxID=1538125 RepID=A0AAV4X673_9ARAC|nr:bromodomain-containing protein 8 [Caerostris darwini]
MAFGGNTMTMGEDNEFLNRLEIDEDGNGYIDKWNTGELLFLSYSVSRSDRNWNSVARSLKPLGEQIRPGDWYTPKNCALQFSKLLNEIDEDGKQKTLPRTEREIPEILLVKNLQEKRIKELELGVKQIKAAADVNTTMIDMIERGEYDGQLLEDIVKTIQEEEKSKQKMYKEYLLKRESLNNSKRLNKSRVTKTKAKTKTVESKKKTSNFPDSIEGSAHQVEEVIRTIKKEIDADDSVSSTKPVAVKTEMDTPITLNALLDSKITTSSSVTSSSPYLTSLLCDVASSNTPATHPLSSLSSLKETEPMEDGDSSKADSEAIVKSKEASPRSSVPQSPYPTPASSPLLNSLLKNSPSSTTSFQISVGREVSPKDVPSPQSFFNPSSALATAAAQQLAVATSTNPPFFQQHDIADTSKPLQSSPVSSASLSAPTLSKLLEMPPSTPGKLPPLPILDPPSVQTPISSVAVPSDLFSSLSKSPNIQATKSKKRPVPESPIKDSTNKETAEPSFSADTSVLQKSLHSYSLADKKAAASGVSKESSALFTNEKSPEKFKSALVDTSLENIALMEEVYNSITETFELNEEKFPSDNEEQNALKLETENDEGQPIDDSPVETVQTEKDTVEEEVSASTVKDKLPTILDVMKKKSSSSVNTNVNQESLSSKETTVSEPIPAKTVSSSSEEVSEKKFYKSRNINKKDEREKSTESSASQSPKKTKIEPVVQATSTPMETNLSEEESKSPEPAVDKQQDVKSIKPKEVKSPAYKKQRFFEKSSPEKKESNESETPAAVRRSGRKGKKGYKKMTKNTPSKQVEPKDQYEFSEENSVGYDSSNTLCYMPRVKDDAQSEDSRDKLISPQESENSNTSLPSSDKKSANLVRSKTDGSKDKISSVRKALFTSDDEKTADSPTSDEISDHLLSEDKLKKWDETCEKKDDISSSSNDSVKRTSKVTDSPKKKSLAVKRNSAGKTLSTNKEKKGSTSDSENFSIGTKDLEEISEQEKSENEEKVSIDMDVDASNSNQSSLIATESDKQLDDAEGSESFQDSIITESSPIPTNETKDNKEASGKQDWFNLVSPKSSEAVSISSEESEEYESDNWENQSMGTNKSASHSSGGRPRPRRKETVQQKKWKRAVSIVLREISCHKNASVFLQKVTDDVAPGYSEVVHRPMDLSLLKKNIDNGVTTTTEEFHRDLMLMFQNAIMYNSSDHDVFQMAMEMQKDVIKMMMTFLQTQAENKDDTNESVSSLRGGRKSLKSSNKLLVSSSSKHKEETD